MFNLEEINRRRRQQGRAALTSDRARAMVDNERGRRRAYNEAPDFDVEDFLLGIALVFSDHSPPLSELAQRAHAQPDYHTPPPSPSPSYDSGPSSSYDSGSSSSSDSGGSSGGGDGGGGGGGD